MVRPNVCVHPVIWFAVCTCIWTAVISVSLSRRPNFLNGFPRLRQLPVMASGNSSAICPDGWILAHASGNDFRLEQNRYCLRVNRRKESWGKAERQCRQQKGFLLQLDKLMMVDEIRLFEYLKLKGFESLWTSMHVEHSSLVWDALRPKMVRPYQGPSEQFGWSKRGWTFDREALAEEAKPECGALRLVEGGMVDSQSIEVVHPISHDEMSKSRGKRSPLEVLPSNSSPVSQSTKADSEDSPSPSKQSVEEKQFEYLQQLLANEGFRERFVETIMGDPNAPDRLLSFMSGHITTAPTTTTTTDQSNLEDDDYHFVTKRSTNALNPRMTTPGSFPQQFATDRPHHNVDAISTVEIVQPGSSGPTQIPTLTPDTSARGTSLPASTVSQVTIDQGNPNNVDSFLNFLFETAFSDSDTGTINETTSSTIENKTGQPGDPPKKNDVVSVSASPSSSSPSPVKTLQGSGFGVIDANAYLRNLIKKATATIAPKNSSSDDVAIDILSRLLTSAMDYGNQADGIAGRTSSTTVPRNEVQMKSTFPNVLNPANFVQDANMERKSTESTEMSGFKNVPNDMDNLVQTTTVSSNSHSSSAMKIQQRQGSNIGKKYSTKVSNSPNVTTAFNFLQDLVGQLRAGFITTTMNTNPVPSSSSLSPSLHTRFLTVPSGTSKLSNQISQNSPSHGTNPDDPKSHFHDSQIHETVTSATTNIQEDNFHVNNINEGTLPPGKVLASAHATPPTNNVHRTSTGSAESVEQSTVSVIVKSTTESQEDSREVDGVTSTTASPEDNSNTMESKGSDSNNNILPDYPQDSSLEVTEDSLSTENVTTTTPAPSNEQSVVEERVSQDNASTTGSEEKDSLVLQGFSKGHDSSNAANEVTTDDELFQTQKTPGSSTSQGKVDGSAEQTGSNDKDVLPGLSQAIEEPEEKMTMSDCEEEKSFVCMTEAIEDLSLVGQCDRNWVGHRLLDRCYRPFPAVLNELEARRQCHRFGANLAAVDTHLHGNVTQLILQQRFGRVKSGVKAWVDTSLNLDIPVDNRCSAVADGKLVRVDCKERLAVICQKDLRFNGISQNDNQPPSNELTYIYNRTSTELQTLWCPLRISNFDDVILWYKDGRPIFDHDGNKHGNADMPNHLDVDLSILQRTGAGGARFLKPAMLQGVYWCEMWRFQPLRRVVSARMVLKFTDVITIHGSITAEPFPEITGVLFNQMGHLEGRAELMERGLAKFNKNITRLLQRRIPVVREVITFIKSLGASEGKSEFVTYITVSQGHLSPRLRGELTHDYLDRLRDALEIAQETLREEWLVSGSVQDALFVSMPDLCPEKYLVDRKTGLGAKFPVTRVNSGALSLQVCDGVYSGTAWCRGDLQSEAFWDDWHITVSCHDVEEVDTSSESKSAEVDDVTESASSDDITNDDDVPQRPQPSIQELMDIDEIDIEVDNVDDVTEWLADVLDEAEDLIDADIELVADVVDKIIGVDRPDSKMSENIIHTVDKVLEASMEELKKAEIETRAPSRLLEDLEEFGELVDIGDSANLRMVAPNLAMEVWDIDDQQPEVVIGFGAKRMTDWTSPLSNLKITTIKDRLWMNQHLSDFDIAIELPESLVKNSVKVSEKSLRLSMFIYRKVGLFMGDSTVDSDANSMVNSAVISASLGGQKVQGLDDKVRLVFKPFQDPSSVSSKTRCVFWDTEIHGGADWSSEGCEYNGTLDGREVCLCDHLTNFAILLDFYGDRRPLSKEHDLSLSILTMIGIGLSIFGLVITIITFLAFKKLRQGRAQQTLFNMAISLLCFQITFLVGFKQTVYWPLCLTVAILLHYLILVSFAWMLIEAVLQYLTFVKVLGTYISRYTLKTVLPAWGIPLLPVVAVLATDYNLYLGRHDYCWMNINAFYYAFALPVGIIIIFNTIMFFVILASLVTRPKGLRSNQINNKARETNLKAAFTIFVLLGLTWLFGYLAIEDARLPFQYIFTVLSSLQGFLIFVLMILRRKQVRDQWNLMCCRRRAESKPTQKKKLSPTSSASCTSSNNSYSNNSRSLPSFYNHTYTSNTNVECSSNSSSGGCDMEDANEYCEVVEEREVGRH